MTRVHPPCYCLFRNLRLYYASLAARRGNCWLAHIRSGSLACILPQEGSGDKRDHSHENDVESDQCVARHASTKEGFGVCQQGRRNDGSRPTGGDGRELIAERCTTVA